MNSEHSAFLFSEARTKEEIPKLAIGDRVVGRLKTAELSRKIKGRSVWFRLYKRKTANWVFQPGPEKAKED